MMITNNSSVTAHTPSTTHSQSINGLANETSSELASATPMRQSLGERRASIDPHQMDVEMTTPAVASTINLNEMDTDSQVDVKKRSLESTDSADDEPVFRPAKRRGAISTWSPSTDNQIQGKKPADVLADQLSDLCKLAKS